MTLFSFVIGQSCSSASILLSLSLPTIYTVSARECYFWSVSHVYLSFEMLNSTMIRKMFENKDELPAKLTELGLVPAEGDYKCPTCATSLKLHKDSSRGDGFRWVCTGRISKNKQVKKFSLLLLF